MDSIPDDLLELILLHPSLEFASDHLRLSAVCRKWRAITRHRTHLSFEEMYPVFWTSRPFVDYFFRVVNPLEALTTLRISGQQFGDRGGVAENLARCCPHIHSLSMASCDLVDTELPEFSRRFPGLRFLDLSDNGAMLCDDALIPLGQNCHELSDLDLDGDYRVTSSSVTAIAQGCPYLVSLKLAWCSVDDDGLLELARHCFKLEALTISGIYGLTETSLLEVAKSVSHLRSLEAASCPAVASSLWCFGMCCPVLQSLGLMSQESLTDTQLLNMLHHSPPLRRVDLRYCHNISDISIINLAHTCRDLEAILLDGCCRITGRAVTELASMCPNLIEIAVCGLTELDDDTLLSLARLRKLQGCSKLTQAAVETVLAQCRSLVELGLPQLTMQVQAAATANDQHGGNYCRVRVAWERHVQRGRRFSWADGDEGLGGIGAMLG